MRDSEAGIVIGAVDVGSPKNIGWALLPDGDSEHGSEIDEFVGVFAERSKGRPAALSFKAPLFIPHGRPADKLTGQREGENGKPWSAGAGATVTTIGLAVVSYVLGQLRAMEPSRRAGLGWRDWPRGDEILLFEAFVSGDNHAGPGEHWKDALNAAERFRAALGDLDGANAVAEPDVLSLVGACVLRTGWSDDVGLLSQSCLVIRP